MTNKPIKFSKITGSTVGFQYLGALVKEQDLYALFAGGEYTHLFKLMETDVYSYIVGFAKKFGTIPKFETIKKLTNVQLPEDMLETSAYYRHLCEQRYVDESIRGTMLVAQDELADIDIEPEATLDAMIASLMKVKVQQYGEQIVDYRDSAGLLMTHYVDTVMKENKGFKTGWPSFDNKSGGLMKNDLISLIGRPAAGKSWLLVWAAYQHWQAGNPVLFQSMEMNPLLILQRLHSINSKIPIKHIQGTSGAALTSKELSKFKSALSDAEGAPAPFWVVDGNLTSTVDDIWALATTLKPSALYLDGGYLVKHPYVKDRYQRVAENADLMKQQLSSICPTMVSWQFSRDATKKGKGATSGKPVDPGLEDIGYTDAIGQVSSVVLGMMEEESIETAKSRRVKIMKGRNGEMGEFRINWQFSGQQAMNFSESKLLDVSDLQFL
jgi:hypothetical protein